MRARRTTSPTGTHGRSVRITVAAVAVALVGGCSAAEPSTAASPATSSTKTASSSAAPEADLSGVYRAEVDPQKMIQAGVPANEAAQNSGVMTLTLSGTTLRVSGLPVSDCTGTYRTTGNRLAIALDNVNCSGDGAMTFAATGDTLQLSNFTPANDVVSRVFWTGQPWQRAA